VLYGTSTPKNLIRVMVHVVGHRPDRRFFAL
jgi:hypothetical protein